MSHQQLLYHVVYSTKWRELTLRDDSFRKDVHAYMASTCQELGGFALEVGGYYDHVHLLVKIPAKIAVAKFIGQLKAGTSKHINAGDRYKVSKFGWQDGYGAFSVSTSQKTRVIHYIRRQIEHHSREKFEDEYLRLLQAHEIEFDPQYVFD